VFLSLTSIAHNAPPAAAVRVLTGLWFLVVTHYAELTNVCSPEYPALLAAGLLAATLFY